MELKTYLLQFKKFWSFIFVLVVIFAVLGFLYTKAGKPTYTQTQTFYLYAPPDQSSADQNSSFYAQEKARNFTDSAVAILQSPDFKSEILSSGQSMIAKKDAPQVIKITTGSHDSQTTANLMEKAVASFNQKEANLGSTQASVLKPISSSQNPSFVQKDPKIFTTASALAGFALAILTVSLKLYFKL